MVWMLFLEVLIRWIVLVSLNSCFRVKNLVD